MNTLSKIILPLIVVIILVYGFIKKINIYDAFLDGAKDGIKICVNIFPSIIAMIFAINIFLDSNFIYALLNVFTPVLKIFNIPLEILPMALLRPISGTASLVIMNDLYAKAGVDSYISTLASILQGCTDTTVYVLALYFGSIGIKRTRYALPVGLFADMVGIIAAFILANVFFY